MNRVWPLSVLLVLASCSSSSESSSDSGITISDSGSPSTDAGTPLVDSGSAQADSGMAAADSGTPIDAGTIVDAGSQVTDSGMTADAGSEQTYMLNTGDCFTFATASSMHSNGMDCGDILALSGANVDLSSPFGADGNGGFCDLPGTYTSLASVPTSYASCAWMSYIEGINGLTNHGLIVRDAAHVHHYRVHVLSNTQPALIFSFAQID